MESAGFVERRADQNDARARRVYLTRAGAKMVSAIRQSVETVELEILSPITDAALEQAAETLHTLKETLLEILGAEAEESESPDIETLS
jgi:DNA-binding MarR family transcriptional regulator